MIAISGIALIINTAMLRDPMVIKMMAENPMPIPLQYVFTYLGLSISIVAGFAMLKGKNWGRLLYTVWGIIGFAVGMATSPMRIAMIPGMILFVIVVVFLFLPKANAYFASGKSLENAQSV